MEQNEKDLFAENAGDILEAEPFDPLAAGDMPEIREMPSYKTCGMKQWHNTDRTAKQI